MYPLKTIQISLIKRVSTIQNRYGLIEKITVIKIDYVLIMYWKYCGPVNIF